MLRELGSLRRCAHKRDYPRRALELNPSLPNFLVNHPTKFLITIVIAGTAGFATWRIFAGRSSPLPGQVPARLQTSVRPSRASGPATIAPETKDFQVATPPEIAVPALLPVETRETPAGQIKILRTFSPDGKLRREEEHLDGKIKAVRHTNSEGFNALEVREDPNGPIRIQRTFNLIEGHLVKEEAFQNGVSVAIPQTAK